MINKQTILQVEKIKKAYETEAGTIQILKGLSTKFYSGEIVSIIGPSGSGNPHYLEYWDHWIPLPKDVLLLNNKILPPCQKKS